MAVSRSLSVRCFTLVSVKAMATKSLKNMKRQGAAVALKEKPAPVLVTKTAEPKILTRVEQLKLLSKLEKAGVLSMMESNGITLKYIEDNKLLSKAEDLGVLSILTDRGTPGAIGNIGLLLLVAVAATIYFVPDDTPSLVALQAVAALVLGGGAVAALAGSSFLGDLQKE